MNDPAGHVNCVLLHDQAARDSNALDEALRDRCWRVEAVTNPHQAFARLCLHERLESSRSAWGLERHQPPVLVLAVDLPAEQLAALLASRDRYLPTIGVWRYQHGALHELRAAAPPRDDPSDRPAPPAPSTRRTFNGPMLRLHEPPPSDVRTGVQADDQDAEESDERAGSTPTLSTEEIDMLLGSGEEPRSS